MKTLVITLCITGLLIPSISAAGQQGHPSWFHVLTGENSDRQALDSIMSDMLNRGALMESSDDDITAEANVNTVLCYYIAFSAVIDFIDCLIYYDFDYNCRSAIIYALIYYYLC